MSLQSQALIQEALLAGWPSTSTYGPTANHKAAFRVGQAELKAIKTKLNGFVKSKLPSLESELKAAGATWIEGQGLIEN